jgi:hypothetical protein
MKELKQILCSGCKRDLEKSVPDGDILFKSPKLLAVTAHCIQAHFATTPNWVCDIVHQLGLMSDIVCSLPDAVDRIISIVHVRGGLDLSLIQPHNNSLGVLNLGSVEAGQWTPSTNPYFWVFCVQEIRTWRVKWGGTPKCWNRLLTRICRATWSSKRRSVASRNWVFLPILSFIM